MKISRDLLFSDLLKVFPTMGAGKSNPNNYFDFFIRNGKSYVSTFNNETITIVELKYTFPEVKVRGVELFEIIKNTEKGSILNVELLDVLQISTDNYCSEIATFIDKVSAYKYLTIPEVDILWKKLPTNFGKKVNLASSCASSDYAHTSIFDFVYVEGDKIVGSNGCRILLQYIDTLVDKMFIKNSTTKIIQAVNPDLYYFSKEWLLFKNSKTNVITANRTLDQRERYPIITTLSDWTEDELKTRKGRFVETLCTIDNGVNLNLIPYVDEILKGVSNCSLFTSETISDKVPENIRVEINDSVITIQGTGKYGKHTHKVSINEQFTTPIAFLISPVLFYETLKSGANIVLDENRMLLVTDDFKCVVALMKKTK